MQISSVHANRRKLMRFTVWIDQKDLAAASMSAADKTAILRWGDNSAEVVDRLERLLAYAKRRNDANRAL